MFFKFYSLGYLLAVAALLAIQGVGLFSFLYFGILALTLWTGLFHRRVLSALITLNIVAEFTWHWGVVC